jgi:serine/threonine protein phosphatase PrpC|tara:strand:+ start:1374 stop:1631 length:258 start_codon:yes stop_codon:yes gene_type:complete
MPDKAPIVSLDGTLRSSQKEKELNSLFAAVFDGSNGDKALNYLRSISIEQVCGPDAIPDRLMHLEGMRYLAAIIENRVKRGREHE